MNRKEIFKKIPQLVKRAILHIRKQIFGEKIVIISANIHAIYNRLIEDSLDAIDFYRQGDLMNTSITCNHIKNLLNSLEICRKMINQNLLLL